MLPYLDRLPPQVRAVQLQQVEGVEEYLRLVPATAQHVEGGHALLIKIVPSRAGLIDVRPQRRTVADWLHPR